VIGRHGLIGGAIAERYARVTSFPTQDTEILFHFGSYTHMDFDKNTSWHQRMAYDSYFAGLDYCVQRGIPFIYPSSALVYESDSNFSRFKVALEALVRSYKTKSLGLRIFPVYGPAERRSVISQWCRTMKEGVRPTVYGDGKQSRDFIYVEDVVDQIVSLIDAGIATSQIADIGTGVRTSFNQIVTLINNALGDTLEARYINRPLSYSDGIYCKDPLPAKVSVADGIGKILESIAA
jgi:nucleoside-diphosphate-sugar epimerase